MENAVNYLRNAPALLKTILRQLHKTNVSIDPNADLAGLYKQIGAGDTVERPTRKGPAMIFNHIKGYPGARVLVGLMASRERVAHLLGAHRGLKEEMKRAKFKAINATPYLPDWYK